MLVFDLILFFLLLLGVVFPGPESRREAYKAAVAKCFHCKHYMSADELDHKILCNYHNKWIGYETALECGQFSKRKENKHD